MNTLSDLPLFGFDLVVADPPWAFELRSAAGEEKSAQAQYACMAIDEIMAMPVADLVGMDSWLFLWATAPMLPQALRVMDAWSFSYRTTIAWRKVTASGKPRRGCGYIARTMHENVLIGALGRPRCSKPLDSLFDGIAREHSRKPESFYANVEAFAPQARRLDLFSRQSRPGWTNWGREAGKFDKEAA